MQDSEKSQTGKTNVLCSDKRIFVKNKSYQKPQTDREKSLSCQTKENIANRCHICKKSDSPCL